MSDQTIQRQCNPILSETSKRTHDETGGRRRKRRRKEEAVGEGEAGRRLNMNYDLCTLRMVDHIEINTT